MKYRFYKFFASCCCWPYNKVDELNEMIDKAQDITRRTFIKNVGLELLRPVELRLGYVVNPSAGMTMSSDWHVSYHKSKLDGNLVYYFTHSAIEHVFVPCDFSWSTSYGAD